MRYWIVEQAEPGAPLWTSPEPFEGDTPQIYQDIEQAWSAGTRRWAIDSDGQFILGMGEKGDLMLKSSWQSYKDHLEAVAHAQCFMALITFAKARIWAKEGAGVRVYIYGQYVTVSRGGDIHGSNAVEPSLYPTVRQKFRAALAAFRRDMVNAHGQAL
jgi:hypothetical protein